VYKSESGNMLKSVDFLAYFLPCFEKTIANTAKVLYNIRCDRITNQFVWRMNTMISAGEFRNGVTFEMDGQVMQVVEFQHVKPGKGAAFVRTKMKNVITGAVTETSFNPTAKFENAYVEKKDMQYSYNDGDLYYFMDQETFDMVPIATELLGDSFRFVKEEMMCKVNSYKGKIFAIEPPTFVELEVTETDPGFKGDTATNVTKPATLETGAEIKVPLFINPGDKIKIDTRTGEYLERAKG
jgi:elongation factor P